MPRERLLETVEPPPKCGERDLNTSRAVTSKDTCRRRLGSDKGCRSFNQLHWHHHLWLFTFRSPYLIVLSMIESISKLSSGRLSPCSANAHSGTSRRKHSKPEPLVENLLTTGSIINFTRATCGESEPEMVITLLAPRLSAIVEFRGRRSDHYAPPQPAGDPP